MPEICMLVGLRARALCGTDPKLNGFNSRMPSCPSRRCANFHPPSRHLAVCIPSVCGNRVWESDGIGPSLMGSGCTTVLPVPQWSPPVGPSENRMPWFKLSLTLNSIRVALRYRVNNWTVSYWEIRKSIHKFILLWINLLVFKFTTKY